jgi:hypothetical protein
MQLALIKRERREGRYASDRCAAELRWSCCFEKGRCRGHERAGIRVLDACCRSGRFEHKASKEVRNVVCASGRGQKDEDERDAVAYSERFHRIAHFGGACACQPISRFFASDGAFVEGVGTVAAVHEIYYVSSRSYIIYNTCFDQWPLLMKYQLSQRCGDDAGRTRR